MRTRRRGRANRVSVGILLGIALAATAAGVIVWNRRARNSPPVAASPKPIVSHRKPTVIHHRLAHAAPLDLYAHDQARMISTVARRALARVYVPNSVGDSVDVIDPNTFKVVQRFPVGALPQHVTPSHDLKTLYVSSDVGNTLTPIDPVTGRPGTPIPVDDPYNLYFTIDGRYAIVVAERLHRLDLRDAHTFHLVRALTVPCAGVNHMDFSADGRYVIASCEFSGPPSEGRRPQVPRPGRSDAPAQILDATGRPLLTRRRGVLCGRPRCRRRLGDRPGPLQGDRLHSHRSRCPRPRRRTERQGALRNHRTEGSVSVISFKSRKVIHKWHIPGGGSPDMGGVSANGKVLWLSGRYNSDVYAIETRTGKLIARIPVGTSPHGLSVWPQPGRYSLGHTGNMR